MNFVPQSSRFQTTVSRILKRRVAIDPLTFTALAFLLEFGAVVAISVVTGVVYHLAAYEASGDISAYLAVGVFGAAVYAVANTARGDYRLGNFLGGRDQSRGILVNWHATILCLLAIGFLTQMSAIFSRAWIALFYASGLLLMVPLRRLLTEATRWASRNGIVAAKRIFVVGAESRIADFMQRYQPAQLGVEIAGCCFLPLLPGPLSDGGAEALRHDLELALKQARNASPDAIFLLAPWTATEAVMQSAEKFGSLPAELHLGPTTWCRNSPMRAVADRTDLDATADVGPAGTDPAADEARSRHRGRHRRDCSAVSAVPRGGVPDQARPPGPGVLPAAALRLQPADFPDREVPHHDGHGGRREHQAGNAQRSSHHEG